MIRPQRELMILTLYRDNINMHFTYFNIDEIQTYLTFGARRNVLGRGVRYEFSIFVNLLIHRIYMLIHLSSEFIFVLMLSHICFLIKYECLMKLNMSPKILNSETPLK